MRQKEVVPAGAGWIETNIREFTGSPIRRIGDEWMLITAGEVTGNDRGNWNTMTASWGGLGVLWSTEAAFCFIRNTRHTYGFANDASLFTLSFFDAAHHGALEICGSLSGRDTDKAAAAGLTPIVFEEGAGAGAVSFEEAREVIVCRKMYTHNFDPARFLDPEIDKTCYPEKDYHRMYIGAILGLWVRG
ncbi:MAG: flavin reductase [Treponema sp.]|jgi:flavin reductase (DIM6/NTAB) family NADH-FMN oxidoreductase RutF|nr:flavin reductase [Treponema sp.]